MDLALPQQAPVQRRLLTWFLVLLVLGVGVRCAAAWYSQGIHHPDEHQQYLEQAFRRVHGYGMTFWEQDQGLRHPLYHVTLSYVLVGLESLGIEDPFVLAGLLRGLQALLVYACLVAFAWSLLRQGHAPAALFLMLVFAVAAEFIYIHVRTLSENAMTIPLMLALLIWRRHPVAAGVALALMVALRLQALVLVFGFWTLSLAFDWRAWRHHSSLHWTAALATTFRLSLGLLAGFLLMGGMDYLAYGRWFHSTIANIQANVLDDKASSFGTLPAYYYLVRGGFALTLTSVLAVPLLLIGMWVRPSLAWLVALFVVGHSLIGHKEYRFLWGILPLICILMAYGFQELYHRWPTRRTAFVGIVAISFIATGAARLFFVPWRENPFFGSALALNAVGKSSDVTGVAVSGTISSGCANYFYLRRNVEIVFLTAEQLGAMRTGQETLSPKVNYVVAGPERSPTVAELPVRAVATCHGWTIFRVEAAPERILSAAGEGRR